MAAAAAIVAFTVGSRRAGPYAQGVRLGGLACVGLLAACGPGFGWEVAGLKVERSLSLSIPGGGAGGGAAGEDLLAVDLRLEDPRGTSEANCDRLRGLAVTGNGHPGAGVVVNYVCPKSAGLQDGEPVGPCSCGTAQWHSRDVSPADDGQLRVTVSDARTKVHIELADPRRAPAALVGAPTFARGSERVLSVPDELLSPCAGTADLRLELSVGGASYLECGPLAGCQPQATLSVTREPGRLRFTVPPGARLGFAWLTFAQSCHPWLGQCGFTGGCSVVVSDRLSVPVTIE